MRHDLQTRRFALRVIAVTALVIGGMTALQVSMAQAAKVDVQSVIARVTSAALEAHINPEGKETTCAAQYVDEEQFAGSGWSGVPQLPCAPESLGAGTTDVTAAVKLETLHIATKYRYRFITTSEGTSVTGPEEEFATFGVSEFSFEALSESMQPFTQAGGHPSELSVYVAANTTTFAGKASPDAIIKDALTNLPPGLVGNPQAMLLCPGRVSEEDRCTAASEVGTVTAYHGLNQFGPRPLFDVIPPEGDAARFAGEVNLSTDAYIDASVRTGSDYGVTAGGYNITAEANPTAFRIKLWGVPNASSHNAERWCLNENKYVLGCEPEGTPKPFLTLPTSCDGAQPVTLSLDSYQAPGEYASKSLTMPAVSGCSALQFAPEIAAKPTTGEADSPTGLTFELRVPQNEEPTGDATPDLRDATVTLPEGMTVNPASAAGLVGCSPEQFGLTTAVDTVPIKTTASPAECPEASKIGKVDIKTPLLNHPLPGEVYLATPYQNPFKSLIAIYIAVYDPISGVVVKLAGEVTLGAEGQLTTTFDENPQLPFEDFKLEFFEGPRAPVITPATCGAFDATSSLLPWSAPESGPAATPAGRLEVTSTPAGGACPSSATAEPYAPSLQAGSQTAKGGAYAPFVVHINRGDGSQRTSQLTISPPPGLIGSVTGVPYCPAADLTSAAAKSGEEEKAAPSCPADTELGTVSVGAGAGPDPFYVEGHVYFAGPYKGAPFSMAIITPAVAGPFDLGTVVVRAGIYINPATAQVSVKSDPIPSGLKGIPLDIRSINVSITRNRFTLNPTNCHTMAVTGQAVSTLGHTANLSDRFQVEGCEHLSFKPGFKVTTHARHSKRYGAYLRVRVTSGSGQANIKSVFVELPKELPSRIATLKLACTERQFAENPAGCPTGSHVGTAVAHTPVLPVPLTGPAIFVSHGGAAFPDLDVVLQGDGVTVDLRGNTNIVKGITSSNFKSVPDVPVSTFELTLPEGTHSALAAEADLCTRTVTKRVRTKVHDKVVYRKHRIKRKRRLVMPTTITGQNGAVIKRSTIIAVEGCATERQSHQQ